MKHIIISILLLSAVSCSSLNNAVDTLNASLDAKIAYDNGIVDEFRNGFKATEDEQLAIDKALNNINAIYLDVKKYEDDPIGLLSTVTQLDYKVAAFKSNYTVLYNIVIVHWNEYTKEGKQKLLGFHEDLEVAETEFNNLLDTTKQNEILNSALSVIKIGAKIAILL